MAEPMWITYLDLFFRATGAIAIPFTLAIAIRTHRERATFEMIDRMYALCHGVQDHVQKQWLIGHLHCIGKPAYDRAVAQIKKHPLSEDKKMQLRIEERQFVIRILMVYEQIYYQWYMTKPSHKARREFLASMLEYFVQRLIPNPRTLAYLDAEQFGVSLHMEPASAAYLREHILRAGVTPDKAGPFEFDPAAVNSSQGVVANG